MEGLAARLRLKHIHTVNANTTIIQLLLLLLLLLLLMIILMIKHKDDDTTNNDNDADKVAANKMSNSNTSNCNRVARLGFAADSRGRAAGKARELASYCGHLFQL